MQLLSAFFSGELPAVCVEPDGRVCVPDLTDRVVLPGSFNPLHLGHQQLAATAARRLGHPVAFELSVTNADKPALSEAEARRRADQFAGQARIWLTRAPTFVEKARIFGDCVFLIGADTAARIVQPRFYGDSATMHAALKEIHACGCRFLVAGRCTANQFLTADAVVPQEYRNLFESLHEADFRCDISSTQLRDG